MTMTKMDQFDTLLVDARNAAPDLTQRINNRPLLIGVISLFLSPTTASHDDVLAVLRVMVERNVIDLDTITHMFIIP